MINYCPGCGAEIKSLKNYCRKHSKRNNYKPLCSKYYQKKINEYKKGDENGR